MVTNYRIKWFKTCWLLKIFFQSDFLKLLKVASLRVVNGKLFHNLQVVTVKVLPPYFWRWHTRFAAFELRVITHWIECISMYELDYCSLLLLLCEKKLTTFSKQNIRYEYDVFSRSRHVLILSYRLNILAITCRPGHADLLLTVWIHLTYE